MKTFLKVLLGILIAVVVFLLGFILFLTITEYRPEPVEDLGSFAAPGSREIEEGQTLDVLSWNIGYCGLGEGADFFMDGGSGVQSTDRETMEYNLSSAAAAIKDIGADLTILQEVDLDSQRTYGVNQAEYLSQGNAVHAKNYSCPYVPFPLPPMGKINSGVFTTTNYIIDDAQRISLPCPFSWPVSTANLKRCLLVSYLPIKGSDKQLVLVNLHLEAYDDGEGKIAQTKQLNDFIRSEYEKGNYVIAGGDFNQTFPGSMEKYPVLNPDLWVPGVLDTGDLPDDWTLAYNLDVPSCRLLNQPYDPSDTAHTQYYALDGFILSPNVQLNSVETVDLAFKYADHNPVHINITLK